MKRKNFIFLLIAVLSLLFSCCWNSKEKTDSEIFTSIEPIEWSDDYVISATNYPSSMQIWNSRTNKLVRNISLEKKERTLNILDIEVLGKNVWIIGYGNTYNLIRINMETGNFEYKNFEFEGSKSRPYSLSSINEEKDNKGTLWVKSYGNEKNGVLISKYSAEGDLLDSFCINENIRTGMQMNSLYINNKNIMICPSGNELHIDMNPICYYILNLDNHTVDETIRFDDIFGKNFMYEKLDISDMNNFLTNVWIIGKNFLGVLIYNPDISNQVLQQLLFEIKNEPTLSFLYTNIHLDDKYMEEIIEKNKKNYILYYNGNIKNDSYGLEMGIFNQETGKQEKKVEIQNSNRIFQQQKNNSTWISMNSYKYVGNGYVTEPEIPEICKFDHETGKVFVYSQDGSERELEWCDVTE